MTDQGWSAAYVNKHLVALRRVLHEAWRLGQMTAEEYQRAADLPTVEHTRLPTGQHVPPGGRGRRARRVRPRRLAGRGPRRGAARGALLHRLPPRRDRRAGAGRLRPRVALAAGARQARQGADGLPDHRRGRAGGAVAGGAGPPAAGRCSARSAGSAGCGSGRRARRHDGQAIADILARRLAEAGPSRVPRTTSGAPSSASCSTPASTWPPPRPSSATPPPPPPPATTAAGTAPPRGRRQDHPAGAQAALTTGAAASGVMAPLLIRPSACDSGLTSGPHRPSPKKGKRGPVC